ncbi:MAG: 30S ribosomal protein S15 [Cytophagales bacterium]|nr:30S ribosomal protein S15 [Cytophagales bacterium]MDW8384035.1 30S ribosomal protein S15 [Flammeovirgaceae bacterium]
MYLSKEEKAEIFAKYSPTKKATDTGSPESQIALLTVRINHITQHLQEHKKDNSSRRGLMKLVGQRKRLLKYLESRDIERYRNIIKELNIRK